MKSYRSIIRRMLNRVGVDITRHQKNLGYELEAEAMAAIRQIRGNTMLNDARLITLYQQVVYCEKRNLPGAFVECGVWKGGAVGLMALANLASSERRRHIYLFDAFDDICEPDAAVDGVKALKAASAFISDTSKPTGKLLPLSGFYKPFGGPGSIQDCKLLLEQSLRYPAESLHYCKGWFQDTIPREFSSIGDIAILRLDGDWYASTKVCLDYLFDLVVDGGIVIFDDYGTFSGCRMAVDEFLKSKGETYFLSTIDCDARYLIVRKL